MFSDSRRCDATMKVGKLKHSKIRRYYLSRRYKLQTLLKSGFVCLEGQAQCDSVITKNFQNQILRILQKNQMILSVVTFDKCWMREKQLFCTGQNR